jgi:hypothetical protein
MRTIRRALLHVALAALIAFGAAAGEDAYRAGFSFGMGAMAGRDGVNSLYAWPWLRGSFGFGPWSASLELPFSLSLPDWAWEPLQCECSLQLEVLRGSTNASVGLSCRTAWPFCPLGASWGVEANASLAMVVDPMVVRASCYIGVDLPAAWPSWTPGRWGASIQAAQFVNEYVAFSVGLSVSARAPDAPWLYRVDGPWRYSFRCFFSLMAFAGPCRIDASWSAPADPRDGAAYCSGAANVSWAW